MSLVATSPLPDTLLEHRAHFTSSSPLSRPSCTDIINQYPVIFTNFKSYLGPRMTCYSIFEFIQIFVSKFKFLLYRLKRWYFIIIIIIIIIIFILAYSGLHIIFTVHRYRRGMHMYN